MIRFKDFSIKKKLIVIQLLTTFVVLIFYGVFLGFNNYRVSRNSVISQLTSMAQLIGANSTPALNFLDNVGAEKVLSSIEAEENIVNAWICDADGNLFAKYSKPGYNNFSFPRVEMESYEFKGGYITLSKRIIQDADVIGMVSLLLNMKQYRQVINQSIIIALFALIVGMILAFLLSNLTQKTISNSIFYLVEIINKVSETGDYSLRVEQREEYRKGNDEIGILFSGFDSMLEQIHFKENERDKAEKELIRHREHLEELVKERTNELEKKTGELEQANIQLQELDRLKSMFIASMSHELRTPLNSIIGFTGILIMGIAGEITEEQSKQLTIVKNSANHLLALINDIIDVSKVEADTVELLIEEFDLANIIQEVKNSFTVAADKKDIKIPLNMPEKLVIKSDERRVKQIIMNLASNAVKFTDEGEIEIKVSKKDEMVEISVRDTGIGMRKEDMDKLFNAFSRITLENRTIEGTGLGLYLSKKIANLLGGEISVESEFGKGSNFIFTMPLVFADNHK